MRQYRKKSIQLRFSTVSAVVGAALLICLIYTMMPSSLLVMPHKPHATEFRRDDLPEDVLNILKDDKDLSKDKKNNSQDHLYLASRGYTVPWCPCVRFGLEVDNIMKARQDAKKNPSLYPASFLEKYNFEGESTCSDYSTQRGAGQKVVSYSYYTPEDKVDLENQHFKKYLGQLYGRAGKIKKSYPGWIMRIYHNITEDDENGNHFLCRIFCAQQHVDLCHVKTLPGIGNLVKRDVVGRLWRFAVMGDPTVSKFLIRDSDSWVLDREVTVVKEWLASEKGFHVIRDHPNHKAIMLAGLWGGSNKDPNLMKSIRNDIFSQPLNLTIKFDQYLLATRVWPRIKNDVLQHDSYNCLRKGHEGSQPFPERRIDGLYCGWGPFKFQERKKVFETNCPRECRPEAHQKWTYC